MSTIYTEEELQTQPLIDSDQWGRLQSELGIDMLREFAEEFFEETREVWLEPDYSASAMDEKSFKSMAHRSAGAAGTIGFKKLRFAFLCLEHAREMDETTRLLKMTREVFQITRQWVHASI